MDTPFLSIIIPCYNVPLSMLRKCLSSLLFTGDYVTYEVWVVDDGSDVDEIVPWVESLNMPNIHAIRQENTGPGGARNTGIAHSTGQYIASVDADDFILYGPQTQMLRLLKERQPDILAQGCQTCYEGRTLDYMLHHDISPSCCSYFIRREVLGDLRFTPHIYHEDEEFCTRLHLIDASLITLNYTSYFYHYREDSITHNQQPAHVEKRYVDYAGVLQRLQALDVPAEAQAPFARRLHIMAMCFLLTLMCDAPDAVFFARHLHALRRTGLYPLPLSWHGMRYFFIAVMSHSTLATRLVAPVVRTLMKIHHESASKRAFTAHAYRTNAEDPDLFDSAAGR